MDHDLLSELLMSTNDELPEPKDTTNKEYRELLNRITLGAEFISSIEKHDPRYAVAVTKYEKLCEKAIRMRGVL